MPGTKKNTTVVQQERKDDEIQVKIAPVQQPIIPEVASEPVDLESKYLVTLQFVETLKNKSLVEDLWQQVMMRVETLKQKKETSSVAKLYPFENRTPDILPFDFNRVVLKNVKDDYINASNMDIFGTRFIVTQTPLVKNQISFWNMVWQEELETVVCLLSDQEMPDVTYLPASKNDSSSVGDFSIMVQSVIFKEGFVERVVKLNNKKLNQTRAIMHLQPADVSSSRHVLPLMAETADQLRKQQRSVSRPVLVHCLDGGDKSGLFIVLSSLVSDMRSDDHWSFIKTNISTLITQRRGILRDKNIIRTVYESFLAFLGQKLGKLDNSQQNVDVAPDQEETDFVGVTVETLKAELKPEFIENTAILDDNKTVDMIADDVKSSNFAQLENELNISPVMNIPKDLSKLADLTLTDSTPTKAKFSKEDFSSPSRKILQENNSDDPLSQLDPLWSLKN